MSLALPTGDEDGTVFVLKVSADLAREVASSIVAAADDLPQTYMPVAGGDC